MKTHIMTATVLVFLVAHFIPREGSADETVAGVTSTYSWIETSDGYRLRSIQTRPVDVSAPLPLVYFVQWLSCDSVEISDGNDGWTQMLRGLVSGGRYLVMRVDKAGVGDSEGPPCRELDYDTELRHHREALSQVAKATDVDASRIVIFGASMGATMAPLLANSHDVAAVAIWGGGAVTWFERLLAFDRNAYELGNTDPEVIARRITQNVAFYVEYLQRGRSPAAIVAADPEMNNVVDSIIGLSQSDHYGRPFAFHQQAQEKNWQAAWSEINVPVFVAYGEYDWFETDKAHNTILRTVNRRTSGRAKMVVIPGMDHHFSVFPNAMSAFEDQAGQPNARPFLQAFLPWLRSAVNEQLLGTPAQEH